ncbi:phosphatase [Oscillospiraceae bacterium OttesenSCG-928-G22]|nr:phosphatase [Oscillospiraceae bacterium OttesenSCG-928-G22]
MNIIADLHTHTVAAGHAFSTLYENCLAAKERGLSHIALTEHAPAMPGGPPKIYFGAMRALPRVIEGVFVLRGVELNILDWEGAVDLSPFYLKQLDYVIASLHENMTKPGSAEEHTEAYLNVIKNEYVDCLGHIGNGAYPCDYERVVRALRDAGKILEINNHSFVTRPGSKENCKIAAGFCKKHGVPVAVTTDAHYMSRVGLFPDALALLKELDFPEELVINSSLKRLSDWFLRRKGLSIEVES